MVTVIHFIFFVVWNSSSH